MRWCVWGTSLRYRVQKGTKLKYPRAPIIQCHSYATLMTRSQKTLQSPHSIIPYPKFISHTHQSSSVRLSCLSPHSLAVLSIIWSLWHAEKIPLWWLCVMRFWYIQSLWETSSSQCTTSLFIHILMFAMYPSQNYIFSTKVCNSSATIPSKNILPPIPSCALAYPRYSEP